MLERKMLDAFFSHVGSHRGMKYLHWNTRAVGQEHGFVFAFEPAAARQVPAHAMRDGVPRPARQEGRAYARIRAGGVGQTVASSLRGAEESPGSIGQGAR